MMPPYTFGSIMQRPDARVYVDSIAEGIREWRAFGNSWGHSWFEKLHTAGNKNKQYWKCGVDCKCMAKMFRTDIWPLSPALDSAHHAMRAKPLEGNASLMSHPLYLDDYQRHCGVKPIFCSLCFKSFSCLFLSWSLYCTPSRCCLSIEPATISW